MIQNKSKKKAKIVPLSIKYKPRSLDEVRGREDIISSLKGFLNQGYVPNLFFKGVAGTGKTLISELFAREYLGERFNRRTCLVVDASTNNTKDFVKDQILGFMKTSSVIKGTKKILVLDEADETSRAAQAVYRRPIEETMKSCLVIMTANYPHRIMEPLKSRFTAYKFGRISFETTDKLVRDVVTGERIKVYGNITTLIEQIYKNGKGEIRYILNNFMEHARSQKKLDQSIIDLVVSENESFAEHLFSGYIETAIETALQDPRGSLSGGINYILESDKVRLSYSGKIKVVDWFSVGLRDLTNGVPYSSVIKTLSHKVNLALQKARAKKEAN